MKINGKQHGAFTIETKGQGGERERKRRCVGGEWRARKESA
jgi:hypothetical protein